MSYKQASPFNSRLPNRHLLFSSHCVFFPPGSPCCLLLALEVARERCLRVKGGGCAAASLSVSTQAAPRSLGNLRGFTVDAWGSVIGGTGASVYKAGLELCLTELRPGDASEALAPVALLRASRCLYCTCIRKRHCEGLALTHPGLRAWTPCVEVSGAKQVVKRL